METALRRLTCLRRVGLALAVVVSACGQSRGPDAAVDTAASDSSGSVDADSATVGDTSTSDVRTDAGGDSSIVPLPIVVRTCDELYAFETRCVREFFDCGDLSTSARAASCDAPFQALLDCYVEQRCGQFSCGPERGVVFDCAF
jgi:hypothetical protein